MANTIATEERAKTVTFNVNERIPFIAKGRLITDLSGLLGPGSGDTVSVLVPGFNKVVKGSAVDTNSNINVQKVPVKIDQWNTSTAYDRVDETLNIASWEEQVSIPNAINMASDIQTRTINSVMAGATQGLIGQGIGDVIKAVSKVKSSRVGLKNSICFHPDAVASLISMSTNTANIFTVKGDDLYQGEFRTINGADAFETPDMGTVTYASVLSFPVATIAEGATSLSITAASGDVGKTIYAGTPFQISGYAAVDALGRQTGSRWFHVAEDVTISAAGTVLLPIAPVYFTGGNFPIPNTKLVGAVGTTAVCPFAAGITYGKALAYADRTAAFVSRIANKFPGTAESATTNFDGAINILSSFSSNLDTGVSRWRFDALHGTSSVYGMGACSLWVPIS